jgi:hypothetical protein
MLPERLRRMHQLRVVYPDLVRARQPPAWAVDQEAIAFLLLWRHAVERDFGVAAERRRIGHFSVPSS